jgi:integrase
MRRGVRLTGIKVVTKANGRRYLYHRDSGIRLPDLPENHPEFLRAYAEAAKAPVRSRVTPGTITAAIDTYLRSAAFDRLAKGTRRAMVGILMRIARQRGAAPLAGLRDRHVRADLEGMSPSVARNRLKAWRAFLSHAMPDGHAASMLKPPRQNATPHRPWTAAEIAAFRARWPEGPRRLAFEVVFVTGARVSDAARLGWQMVEGGWLTFRQQKTGGRVDLPLTAESRWFPDERAQLVNMLPADRMIWIVTEAGRPRSAAALSGYLADAIAKAGIDGATPHGLRATRAVMMAEKGASAHEIAAWTGHASLKEVSHYTRDADRKVILGGTEQKRNRGNRTLSVAKSPAKPQ